MFFVFFFEFVFLNLFGVNEYDKCQCLQTKYHIDLSARVTVRLDRIAPNRENLLLRKCHCLAVTFSEKHFSARDPSIGKCGNHGNPLPPMGSEWVLLAGQTK